MGGGEGGMSQSIAHENRKTDKQALTLYRHRLNKARLTVKEIATDCHAGCLFREQREGRRGNRFLPGTSAGFGKAH